MSVALVERLARCFWMGDRDAALELLHPEVRIQQPRSLPHGGWHHGRDGMEKTGALRVFQQDTYLPNGRVTRR